ncbi:hypothetical protein SPBR_00552 [Sporothrix brasiliensis 5110]|uniref:Xylanolytic transcriptional activator regulatory domain-containing protein n=1 Tax=Sporothrix brasiliensis 5110 TaxID=1398154 RepID=A0A0C2FH85_9PEZI|nr:uncharacterized protein SPBR_00552 [Sporothrix brasiliensis 5110]KIH90458.1 hypothetical protein SPBR_00552 [Sporothrix brasiliensis 5110]
MERWTSQQMPSSKASYGLLMAMCSLAAYRIQKGIAPAAVGFARHLKPQVYLQEAMSSVDLSLAVQKQTEELQAVALLCVTGLEKGDAALLQQYLGLYHATVANQSLYDENRWPPSMHDMEKEQRRRLYWYMYRLEVHTALVMGHPVRCPELESLVAYPQIPDFDRFGGNYGDGTEAINDNGEVEWLTGWNFVTDLYRGLEHLLAKFRPRRLSTHHSRIGPGSTLPTMFLIDFDPESKILMPLKAALNKLPIRFKHAQPLSSNVSLNRCGFQATNIVCTYQLVRIMVYAFSKATFSQACRTAIDLVEDMASIPMDYLKWTTLAAHFRLCIKEYLESLQSSFTYVRRASMRMGEYVEEIDQVLLSRERDDTHRQGSCIQKDDGMKQQQLYMPFPDQDTSHAWRDVFRD